MFDIGFSELILIGVVALVVIGPDRLPGAARVAGMWLGRIKRSFNTIKEDVEILEKERKMLKDTTDKANQMFSDKPLQNLLKDSSPTKDSSAADKEQSS